MRQISFPLILLSALIPWLPPDTRSQTKTENGSRRNLVIFVSDGMRHGSSNERDTATLWAVRTRGVYFQNSHSLFPTFTTANASAIATGHGWGDTGDFSNTIWTGYPIFEKGILAWPQQLPCPLSRFSQAEG